MNHIYSPAPQRYDASSVDYSSDEEELNPAACKNPQSRQVKTVQTKAVLRPEPMLRYTKGLIKPLSLQNIQSCITSFTSLFRSRHTFFNPMAQWLISLSLFGIYTINKLAANQNRSQPPQSNHTQLLSQPPQTTALSIPSSRPIVPKAAIPVSSHSTYALLIFGISLLVSLPLLLQAYYLLPDSRGLSMKVKQFLGFKQPETKPVDRHGFQHDLRLHKASIPDRDDDLYTDEIPDYLLKEEIQRRKALATMTWEERYRYFVSGEEPNPLPAEPKTPPVLFFNQSLSCSPEKIRKPCRNDLPTRTR